MKVQNLMVGDWVTVVADNRLFPDEYVGQTIPCKVMGFDEKPIIYPSLPEKASSIDLRPQIGMTVKVANNFYFMYFAPERLSPIPLTKKILEKNGLYLHCRQIGEGYDKHCPTGYFKEDVAYLLELTLRPNGDIYWSISGDEYCVLPLAFVHELQHAIRLCGIEKEIVI